VQHFHDGVLDRAADEIAIHSGAILPMTVFALPQSGSFRVW